MNKSIIPIVFIAILISLPIVKANIVYPSSGENLILITIAFFITGPMWFFVALGLLFQRKLSLYFTFISTSLILSAFVILKSIPNMFTTPVDDFVFILGYASSFSVIAFASSVIVEKINKLKNIRSKFSCLNKMHALALFLIVEFAILFPLFFSADMIASFAFLQAIWISDIGGIVALALVFVFFTNYAKKNKLKPKQFLAGKSSIIAAAFLCLYLFLVFLPVGGGFQNSKSFLVPVHAASFYFFFLFVFDYFLCKNTK